MPRVVRGGRNLPPTPTPTPTRPPTRMCVMYALKNLAYGTNKYNIDPDDATPVRAAAAGD